MTVVPLPRSSTKEREDDPSIDIIVSGARPNWKPLQEKHRAMASELESRCKMMGLYVSGDMRSAIEEAFDEVGLRWIDASVGAGRMG